jgi:hypothetical protein
MKTLLIQLFVIIIIFGCTKIQNDMLEDNPEPVFSCDFLNDTIIKDYGSVLSESMDSFYYKIWKSEIVNNNDIDISYFNKHFSNVKISSKNWNGGITVQIDYLCTFDWLRFKVKDQFMVKLNSSWNNYKHLNIPRDTLLSDEWTRYSIRNEIWYSGICQIKKIESLHYSSCAEACQSFKDLSGYEVIFPQSISLYVPGKVPKVDGYPYFIGYGLIDSTTYECVRGYYNIVNGEIEVWEDYCGPIF